MAEIALKPFVMQDCVLTFGSNSYQASASSIQLVPTPVGKTFKGLKTDAIVQLGGRATWVCNVKFAQDFETTNSLSQYLLDNEGSTIVVVAAPRNGIGKSFTFSVLIQPGAIGGDVDAIAESSVSLPIAGRPAYVP